MDITGAVKCAGIGAPTARRGALGEESGQVTETMGFGLDACKVNMDVEGPEMQQNVWVRVGVGAHGRLTTRAAAPARGKLLFEEFGRRVAAV